MEIAELDLTDHLARTPLEEAILDLIGEGRSYRDIATELGISKHKVEDMIALFRQRVGDVYDVQGLLRRTKPRR